MATNLRIASAILPMLTAIIATVVARVSLLVAAIFTGETLVLLVIGIFTWREITRIERSLRREDY